ncbi:hypothetical protein HC928_09080 [bacterium]|nr:hypothetical protein [bacterium]
MPQIAYRELTSGGRENGIFPASSVYDILAVRQLFESNVVRAIHRGNSAMMMQPIARDVVTQIEKDLQARQSTESVIYNVYGLTGIGKSYVLRAFLGDKRQESFASTLRLDFDTSKQDGEELSITIAQALDEIRHSYASTSITLPELNPDDLAKIGDLPVIFQWVGDNTQPPRLLLLDGVDDVPYWKEIQRYIIKPLTTSKADGISVHVLVASQSPIFWHFWELREITTLEEIPPFPEVETRAFLDQNYPRYAIHTKQLHTLTGGYPAALAELLPILVEEETNDSDRAPTGSADAGDPDISHEDLSAAIAEYKELGWIGLLRRTDPASLETVLHAAFPNDERWRDAPQPGFNKSIHELRQQLWHAGYDLPLNPEQRAWLKDYQQQQNLEIYRKVLKHLIVRYEELIGNREFAQLYRDVFNEWLYLHVCLGEVPPDYNSVWRDLAIRRNAAIQALSKDDELITLVHSSPKRADYLAFLPELAPLNITSQTKKQYIDKLLKRLHRALGNNDLVQPSLQAVLRAAYRAGDRDKGNRFELKHLQHKLSNLRPGKVGDLVLLLNSRSFVLYDAQSRSFELNQVLRSFVQVFPERVETEEQSQDNSPSSNHHSASQ